MEIRADRRTREIDPDPARVQDAREVAERYRSDQLRLARLLRAIERGRDHLLLGHASVRDFAALELGIARRDVRSLLDLGRSLDMAVRDDAAAPGTSDSAEDGLAAEPDGHGTSEDVESLVRQRRMPVDNAAELGRLLRVPGVLEDADRADWMARAQTMSPWRFRQEVRRTLEEVAQGEPVVPLDLSVTESARSDFHRARELASRRAGRALTDGQVFALVVRRYVLAEDPRHVGGKKRRLGPTAGRPASRYVPAAVERAIRRRAGDRCEVEGCSNTTFLELMHLRVPHALGGDREVSNMALGCSTHHVLHDAGVLRFTGWTRGADGVDHPRFRTSVSTSFGRPSADAVGQAPILERDVARERTPATPIPDGVAEPPPRPSDRSLRVRQDWGAVRERVPKYRQELRRCVGARGPPRQASRPSRVRRATVHAD